MSSNENVSKPSLEKFHQMKDDPKVQEATAAYLYQLGASAMAREQVDAWYSLAIGLFKPQADPKYKHDKALTQNTLYLAKTADAHKVFEYVDMLQSESGVRVPKAGVCAKLYAEGIFFLVRWHLIKVAEQYTGISGDAHLGVNDQTKIAELIARSVGYRHDGKTLANAFAPAYRKVAVIESEAGLPMYAFDIDGEVVESGHKEFEKLHLIERLTLARDNNRLVHSLIANVRNKTAGFEVHESVDLADTSNVKSICANQLKIASFKYAAEVAPDYI